MDSEKEDAYYKSFLVANLAQILKIVLFIYFLDFVYLFLERGEGKEKERDRNIDV